MPKLEVNIEIEQLIKALRKLSPGELETLEIMFDPKLKMNIFKRWKKAKQELREGKALSKEELFSK